jgi:hypothetical protein
MQHRISVLKRPGLPRAPARGSTYVVFEHGYTSGSMCQRLARLGGSREEIDLKVIVYDH